MTARERVAGTVANYVDERTGAAKWLKKNLNKVFGYLVQLNKKDNYSIYLRESVSLIPGKEAVTDAIKRCFLSCKYWILFVGWFSKREKFQKNC